MSISADRPAGARPALRDAFGRPYEPAVGPRLKVLLFVIFLATATFFYSLTDGSLAFAFTAGVAVAKRLLHDFLPRMYERCRHAEPMDATGFLLGGLTPVVREPFVFLNYLLTCKPAGEVAELFGQIRERVGRIDLKQTSKCLDAASLSEFKARAARARASRSRALSAGNQYTGTLPAATSSNETTVMSGSSPR